MRTPAGPASQPAPRRWLKMLFGLLLAMTCGMALAATPADSPAPADPVVLRFASVGDSRHDPKAPDITPQDRIWLQNSRVLSRMVRELQAVRPDLLFFNGDMIMGYSTDVNILNRQYAYWRGMVATLLETGTYVVPIAGNHELQELTTDSRGKPVKLARPAAEDAWRANMGDLLIDLRRWQQMFGEPPAAWDPANTPPINGPDNIRTDQRQLTFSFDFRQSHFVVINTDAVGNDGRAPVAWLADDLARARRRGMRHFFIFGHRPAYTYRYAPGVAAVGLDSFPDNQRAFWDLAEQYRATYFCGHAHVFNAMQPRAGQGGASWQVLAGSGGAPFDVKPGETGNPDDRAYAWVLVTVHASGRVHLDAYGFDERFGPTRVIRSLDL